MSKDRVQAHTSKRVNRRIAADADRRVSASAGQSPGRIAARIAALEGEWDMERWLETNASIIALAGTLLGLFVNRRFLAIPVLVLGFLLMHALQGWCPPVPILRRMGVRTRREIDEEKYALKALRGDFDEVKPAPAKPKRSAARAMTAARA